MEVLLIRHGKTAGNIAKRYIGRTDEPLCAEGIAHAQRSGTDESVTTLVVSPMRRAVETAKIKFPNALQTICADLREMDFGDFEGRSADEMVDDGAYRRWVDSNCTLPCPNGEQLSDFNHRVRTAFDATVRLCIQQGKQQLVIVAHGGTLMSILEAYAKPAKQYYEWYVDNCGGYRARLDESTWTTAPSLINYEKL